MPKIVVGLNSLEPHTWTTHQVKDTCAFLVRTFGEKLPGTAKIFHERIDLEHEVTPRSKKEIAKLQALEGTLWVVVYPADPVTIIGTGALIVGANILAWLLEDKKPRDPARNFRPVTGSPNNKLGERQNTARVLGRIPDIYGMVRSTPDLLQLPYTTYVNHREVETAYMCVGRGNYLITDIREGDTLASQVNGLSYAVYEAGDIPTGSPGSDNAVDEFGDFIDDPVFTVRRIEPVNGQVLEPDNAFHIFGDVPIPRTFIGGGGYSVDTSYWAKLLFRHVSAGVGEIWIGKVNASKVAVGDVYQLHYFTEGATHSATVFPPFRKSQPLAVTDHWGSWQHTATPIPDLSGTVEITAITNDTNGDPAFIVVNLLGGAGQEAQWAAIPTWLGGFGAGIANGNPAYTNVRLANGRCLLVPAASAPKGWVGPFFCDDALTAPNVRTVSCNFVSPQGLYVDDGKSSLPFDVEIEVEVTAADAAGLPVGSPALHSAVIPGTLSSRTTRAITLRIGGPEVQGPFLIRARRLTRTPYKQDAPGQFTGFASTDLNAAFADLVPLSIVGGAVVAHPALALTGSRVPFNGFNGGNASIASTGNSSYVPFKGNAEDQVLWTHCYALTTITPGSLGNITTVRTRTVVNEGAKIQSERRLNCFAYRKILTWNGVTFAGPAVTDNNAENILFSVLKDFYIGNLPDAQIDFVGIAAAFEQVRASFGGPESDGFGGEVAGQFNHTFDDDRTSLEDTIATICRACFCTHYREGDIVKVKPDMAQVDSVLLINHRNRVPGTEKRTINFGTEEEFDGVKVDYVDISTDFPNRSEIQTYTIPPLGTALRPKTLNLPGLRTKKHAAWHAWREYNRMFYQNTVVEMEVLEEAALLSIDDRLLVADGTRPDTEDGEILDVSGSTLTTSQDVTTGLGPIPATIFLQHTDGTVESIAVASVTDPRTVVLSAPPSVTLETDPALGVRTGYVVVRNSSNIPMAFRLTEKNWVSRGIYSLTAVNYSNAVYWTDGLMLWMPFVTFAGLTDHADWGPYELATSITGGSTTTDGTRGRVYQGTANTHHISITTANVFAAESYTKSCWVNKAGTGVAGSLCGSVESGNETFFISATDVLTAGHNSTVHVSSAGFPIGNWAMATVTYQQNVGGGTDDRMRLYVNGELVDEFVGTGSTMHRPPSNLRIFGAFSGINGLVGMGDEFRYWMRELQPEEVRELHNKTRI